ncbi:MAG: GNAT family N-acetyltransferase [Thermoplasmata archaeon]
MNQLLARPADGPEDREDVVTVSAPEGAISIELVPLREGVARGHARLSPRNVRLSEGFAKQLSDELIARQYQRILVQDTKKQSITKLMRRCRWHTERAIQPRMRRHCSMVTTYDVPIDAGLFDEKGFKPDISNTGHMNGISVDIEGRTAWAFYTDDGETARIVSEGERRQGMFIVSKDDDLFEVADCLVQFLAIAKKSWAVFSMDCGRFVRQYDPMIMWRMVADSPKPFDHGAAPLSKENRRAAIRLFSEYYDESVVQSMFRLQSLKGEGNYSMYLVNGGFVIVRYEGDAGLIYDIYVTPAKQGEGLGAELMRCAMTALAGRVSRAYLHTSYPRAKRLYEKFGFRVTNAQLGIRLDEIVLRPPRADQDQNQTK